jgi:hypothetical protein
MRVFHEFGFTPRQLGLEYGVHTDTARNVVKGKSFQPPKPPQPSKLRKLTDDQVRQIRRWAAEEGYGEARIQRRLKYLGVEIGRSTIRQVINRESYQEVMQACGTGGS